MLLKKLDDDDDDDEGFLNGFSNVLVVGEMILWYLVYNED